MSERHSLEDFYDVFIAHTDLTFVGETDFIKSGEIIRDGRIDIELGDDWPLRIPVYLRYSTDNPGAISSLKAYWEILPAVFSSIRIGVRGVKYLLLLAGRLYERCGALGVFGMTKTLGLSTLFGKGTAYRLRDLLDQGRFYEASLLFTRHRRSDIRVYDSQEVYSYPPGYLSMGEIRLHDISKLIVAGRTVCFRCSFAKDQNINPAVGFVHLSRTGTRITRAEFFT